MHVQRLDGRHEGHHVGATAQGGTLVAPSAAVEYGRCGGTCHQGYSLGKIALSAKTEAAAKRASIAVAMVIKTGFFILLFSFFPADINPSYMIEITAFDDKLRVSVSEIVVESLLAIFSGTSHCSCSSRWKSLQQTP